MTSLIHFLLRSFPALFLACFTLAAPAQMLSSPSQMLADRGDWQILEARYGTAQRNVDVTQRLKEIARNDGTFKVSNQLMGTDPHPGQPKSLRIYAQNNSGWQRTFEYPEESLVSGAMFTGWTAGNWGRGGWSGGWGGDAGQGGSGYDAGQWRITGARYGTAQRNIDVTGRLQQLARRDVQFRVDNDTMGSDPHPGSQKTLRIYARDAGGNVRTFEFHEEEIVNGAQFTAWSSGNWGQGGGGETSWGHPPAIGKPVGPRVTIVSAQYGEGFTRTDVTARLRSMVRDGRLSVRVDNDGMGADPAPGRQKMLWVTYEVAGQGQRQVRVQEGQVFQLP